jgi:hypothetical protein
MNYVIELQKDLAKGFSMSELEVLIGLPMNSLSAVIKGKRVLSKKSRVKVDRWMSGVKPDPLLMNKGVVYGDTKLFGSMSFTDDGKKEIDLLPEPVVIKTAGGNNTARIAELRQELNGLGFGELGKRMRKVIEGKIKELGG